MAIAKKTLKKTISENKPPKADAIYFSVRKIKQLASYTNEFIPVQDDENFVVNYNYKLGFTREGLVDFTLRAYYVYKNKPDEILISIDVQNIFEFQGIEYFIDKNNILKLPSIFVMTMINLSVSHLRALLAAHTSGTIYSDLILPIVDPREMGNRFFPEMMKD